MGIMDPRTLKDAVRALIVAVPGVTKVAKRLGETPPWAEGRTGGGLNYWEINLSDSIPRPDGGSRDVEELITIQMDVWMPWSEKDGSEDRWDTVTRAVQQAFVVNRFIAGTQSDPYLPSRINNSVTTPFADRISTKLCHHCTIVQKVAHHFEYTAL
jgi:hypothetical protein